MAMRMTRNQRFLLFGAGAIVFALFIAIALSRLIGWRLLSAVKASAVSYGIDVVASRPFWTGNSVVMSDFVARRSLSSGMVLVGARRAKLTGVTGALVGGNRQVDLLNSVIDVAMGGDSASIGTLDVETSSAGDSSIVRVTQRGAFLDVDIAHVDLRVRGSDGKILLWLRDSSLRGIASAAQAARGRDDVSFDGTLKAKTVLAGIVSKGTVRASDLTGRVSIHGRLLRLDALTLKLADHSTVAGSYWLNTDDSSYGAQLAPSAVDLVEVVDETFNKMITTDDEQLSFLQPTRSSLLSDSISALAVTISASIKGRGDSFLGLTGDGEIGLAGGPIPDIPLFEPLSDMVPRQQSNPPTYSRAVLKFLVGGDGVTFMPTNIQASLADLCFGGNVHYPLSRAGQLWLLVRLPSRRGLDLRMSPDVTRFLTSGDYLTIPFALKIKKKSIEQFRPSLSPDIFEDGSAPFETIKRTAFFGALDRCWPPTAGGQR
jgi:hypothetical protein